MRLFHARPGRTTLAAVAAVAVCAGSGLGASPAAAGKSDTSASGKTSKSTFSATGRKIG